MKTYEAMYITIPTEEASNNVCEMAKKIINEYGKVLKVDVWGKKRLAYSIMDNEEGIYTLITFEAPRTCIIELDRKLRNSEEALRHMIISKGE